MQSHFYNYPKVVPVVAGPSPHREDGEPGTPPPPAGRDAESPPQPERS
jgi:hypothetical protein